MSNPSKAKGSDAERRLVEWLRQNGYPQACRTLAGGSVDRGDVAGVPHVTIEVKSMASLADAISSGLRDLAVEQANNGTHDGVLIVKKRGTSDPAEWYAVQPVRDWFEGRP